jgi:hypothetical protein
MSTAYCYRCFELTKEGKRTTHVATDVKKKAVVKDVPPSASFCPDCKEALFWVTEPKYETPSKVTYFDERYLHS